MSVRLGSIIICHNNIIAQFTIVARRIVCIDFDKVPNKRALFPRFVSQWCWSHKVHSILIIAKLSVRRTFVQCITGLFERSSLIWGNSLKPTHIISPSAILASVSRSPFNLWPSISTTCTRDFRNLTVFNELPPSRCFSNPFPFSISCHH